MDAWAVFLNSLVTVAPAIGGTGGVGLALFAILIQRQVLWFDRQHQAVIKEKDVQIKLVTDELIRTREDRDTYKEAGRLDQERADSIQGKVMETVVPVLSGVDHALTELARQAAAREGTG